MMTHNQLVRLNRILFELNELRADLEGLPAAVANPELKLKIAMAECGHCNRTGRCFPMTKDTMMVVVCPVCNGV